MKFTAAQIAGILEGEVVGNPDAEVFKLSKIEEGTEGSLTFLANPKYLNYIYSTQSEKYSEKLDDEVNNIIKNAYNTARNVLKSSYEIIQYISFILHNEAVLTYNEVIEHIHHIDPHYFN
jgi:UDP-3-O-[3-hydroxymyristoyl] glucosamine N-acyltransferase